MLILKMMFAFEFLLFYYLHKKILQIDCDKWFRISLQVNNLIVFLLDLHDQEAFDDNNIA